LATATLFLGMWSLIRRSDPVDRRLAEYGAALNAEKGAAASADPNGARSGINGLARKLDLVGNLDSKLSRAGVRFTALEFLMICAGLGLFGFAFGTWRAGVVVGAVLGIVLAYAPQIYVKMLIGRVRRQFTHQLPDVLVLLVGALRAGYGLTQSFQTLAEQMPAPASIEFGRVLRAINLGVPVDQALHQMVERIGTDEVELVITAIVVQHQMGGNLAETLELIGETIRDRIDIQREVSALTAEEQLTGYVLSALPTALAILLSLINPGFMKPLFAPGIVRILPITAIVMQIMGFFVMRQMLKIEV
jgi:tight adherence protein B